MRYYFIISMLMLFSNINAQNLYGDIDHDGEITIADLSQIVSILKGETIAETIQIRDGKIYEPWNNESGTYSILGVKYKEPEAVDLGLPSGTKWASCNIGANNPYECGLHFAWGEVIPKFNYDISNYNSDCGCYRLNDGGDAAYTNMHNNWKTPTSTQCYELINNCNIKQETFNGVPGYRVKGINGNSIFIPSAGIYKKRELEGVGTIAYYWSSSSSGVSISSTDAVYIDFESNNTYYYKYGYHGFSVRPVLNK